MLNCKVVMFIRYVMMLNCQVVMFSHCVMMSVERLLCSLIMLFDYNVSLLFLCVIISCSFTINFI